MNINKDIFISFFCNFLFIVLFDSLMLFVLLQLYYFQFYNLCFRLFEDQSVTIIK